MALGASMTEVLASSGDEESVNEMEGLELEEEEVHFVNTFDISEGWIPSESSFAEADEDIVKYDLNFDFVTVDDLYLDDPLRGIPESWIE